MTVQHGPRVIGEEAYNKAVAAERLGVNKFGARVTDPHFGERVEEEPLERVELGEGAEEFVEKFYTANAKTAVSMVKKAATTMEHAKALRVLEKKNPKWPGGRTSVLGAINAAIAGFVAE